MKQVSLIVCILFVLLFTPNCTFQHNVEITLGVDHPWEQASGRKLWYTVVYNTLSGTERVHLSIGQRSLRIALPHRQSLIIAAYPLDEGLPLGGYSNPLKVDSAQVLLQREQGPLAGTLLELAKRYPEIVVTVNFEKIWRTIANLDPSGANIEWNSLCRALVEDQVDNSSFVMNATKEFALEGLPAGIWVCETPLYPNLYGFSQQPVQVTGLAPGVTRYLNLESKLTLRIIWPESALPEEEQQSPFWHITRADALFLLSEANYQSLL